MSKATPENIWTVVPDRLLDSDRTLQFLVKERLQSKKSMENADIAIRDYMLKNLPVPSDDMLPGLTDGQRDVLDFIIGCYSGDGSRKRLPSVLLTLLSERGIYSKRPINGDH